MEGTRKQVIMKTPLFIGILVILSSAGTFAGTPQKAAPKKVYSGSGGWGPEGRYNRLFKEGLIQTFQGTVTRVGTFCPFDGMHDGVYLLLQTPREAVDIHLGPEWYVNHQDFRIQRGDHVTVTGARILFGDGSAIMATELIKGDEVLKLRGNDGEPVWIAWKKQLPIETP